MTNTETTAYQALYEAACRARDLEANFYLAGKPKMYAAYGAQAREHATLIQYWRDGQPAGHIVQVTDPRDAAWLVADGERSGYHVLVSYPRTETEKAAS